MNNVNKVKFFKRYSSCHLQIKSWEGQEKSFSEVLQGREELTADGQINYEL